jgi:hypothetical protein
LLTRNTLQDAFFLEERGDPHSLDSLFSNKFKLVSRKFSNPLDPWVREAIYKLQQPEKIEQRFGGDEDRKKKEYAIFVPDKARQQGQSKAIAKVTLLFCVGAEINRHGLRSFFADSPDRVLITVPGVEVDTTRGLLKPWGVGITTEQIRQLLADAGVPNMEPEVRIIACYSTGYRGLNGTINNSLIPLDKVERIIFYDALYRGDEPALPKDEKPPLRAPTAPNSPFNT